MCMVYYYGQHIVLNMKKEKYKRKVISLASLWYLNTASQDFLEIFMDEWENHCDQ